MRLCSLTGRTTWRSGCCSVFGWFWVHWTAFLNSGWVREMLQGSLVELWFTCLRSCNPWVLVTESDTFRTGVCSWSDCDGDECWDSDIECSSCSDSTSHTFGFVVLLRFGCNVSVIIMNIKSLGAHIIIDSTRKINTDLTWTEWSGLFPTLALCCSP